MHFPTEGRGALRVAGFAVLALALFTGCGSATSPGSDSIQAGPGSGGDEAGKGPWNLIGSWLVDAPGEETGTVLRLADGELSVWRDCGPLYGSWRADENALFVAEVNGWSGSCDVTSPRTPTWLASAVGFVITDDGASLLDSRGDVVASLRPGGRPTAGPNTDPSEAEPPKLTEEVRRTFQPALPLPAGVAPADADSMVGRWLPVDSGETDMAREQPRLDLHSDGSWTGSDGCNGVGGRWVSGDNGAVLATSGPRTLIGCDNIDVGGWFADAYRAGFDGDVLVLFGRNGQETGRLHRG